MLNFLMRTAKCLGPVQYMHIWHDCSGQDGQASWFLDKIVLRDVLTDETFVYSLLILYIRETNRTASEINKYCTLTYEIFYFNFQFCIFMQQLVGS